MSTTIETQSAEAPPSKPSRRKPKPKFVVYLDGVACGRTAYPRKFIGRKLIPGGGTLVKRPQDPEYFKGKKSAQKAIFRADRLRRMLRDSVCDVAENHRRFAEPGLFTIKPFVPAQL